MPFGSDVPNCAALIPDGTVALAGPGSIRVAHTAQEHLDPGRPARRDRTQPQAALHFLKQ